MASWWREFLSVYLRYLAVAVALIPAAVLFAVLSEGDGSVSTLVLIVCGSAGLLCAWAGWRVVARIDRITARAGPLSALQSPAAATLREANSALRAGDSVLADQGFNIVVSSVVFSVEAEPVELSVRVKVHDELFVSKSVGPDTEPAADTLMVFQHVDV